MQLFAPAENSVVTLDGTKSSGVMTRPIWKLLHRLPMFPGAMPDDLSVPKII